MSGDNWAILALMTVFWVSLVGTMWNLKAESRRPQPIETIKARWTDEEAIRVSEARNEGVKW